jgi:dipeptidyl aminopeptidase/acylaminoacyl peptidase
VPEAYRYYSPLTYLYQAASPTLLRAGDADLMDIQMRYTWLYQAGVEVEAIHYRGDGHGFSRPKHRRDSLERMLV